MDHLKLSQQLLKLARARKAIITTAESCTGGLVAGAITEAPGASDIFERGFVTYSNAAKIDLLRVSPATLATRGAVSEEVAREMAKGALENAGADLAISITGIAGPGGSEHKPEGRVCFALASVDECKSETVEYGAIGRANVRRSSVGHALERLIGALSQ